MNAKTSLLLLIAPILGMCLLPSCGNQSNGNFSDSSFNPLVAPGSKKTKSKADQGLIKGSYAEAKNPKTHFFKKLPKGVSSKADSYLDQGTVLEITDIKKHYFKVRVVKNGKEGYVFKNTVIEQSPDAPPPPPGLSPEMLASLNKQNKTRPSYTKLPPLPDLDLLMPGDPLLDDGPLLSDDELLNAPLAPDEPIIGAGAAVSPDRGISSDLLLRQNRAADPLLPQLKKKALPKTKAKAAKVKKAAKKTVEKPKATKEKVLNSSKIEEEPILKD